MARLKIGTLYSRQHAEAKISPPFSPEAMVMLDDHCPRRREQTMFKSPLLRKVTFELFPAALLSFTGSIFVAQYFRPTVVVTPPSSEISVRDELIRAIQQERAIILDQMARIAATNAFNASVRSPANVEATTQFSGQKTNATAAATPPSRNVQPRPQAKTNVASTQQPDDMKKQMPVRIDVSKTDASPSVSNSVLQPPIAIVPDNIQRADADHDNKFSALNAVSRPFERTAFWLKTLKSKIADQLSISSAADTPRFPGHGIY